MLSTYVANHNTLYTSTFPSFYDNNRILQNIKVQCKRMMLQNLRFLFSDDLNFQAQNENNDVIKIIIKEKCTVYYKLRVSMSTGYKNAMECKLAGARLLCTSDLLPCWLTSGLKLCPRRHSECIKSCKTQQILVYGVTHEEQSCKGSIGFHNHGEGPQYQVLG